MRQVRRWVGPRLGAATALVALAVGVSAFGAFALPWLRADTPNARVVGVAPLDVPLGALAEPRCRHRHEPADL